MPVKRGEIYLVNWSPARGSEQKGMRPALVIQNNAGNEHSSTTIVAAISTRFSSKIYPFQVLLRARETGLDSDSVVDFGQIMTIARARLIKKIGQVKNETISAINEAIMHSLALQ